MPNTELDEDFLRELGEKGYSSYLISDLGYGGNKKKMFTNEPAPLFKSHAWKYDLTEALLYKLSSMVSPERAERVNVQFEHPDLREYMPGATTTTMRSGMQIVRPGQFAPEHLHSARSFRIVLKGPEKDAYTTAGGVDLPLRKGDIVLNPDWVMHSHRNTSKEDVLWFNGMDVIIAYWMGGVFYSDSKNKRVESGSDIGLHLKQWGRTAVNFKGKQKIDGNLMYYPREYTIEPLKDEGRSNGYEHETVREILNPKNAGPLFPTLDVKFWYLPSRAISNTYQRAGNSVFLVYSGSGRMKLEDKEIELKQFDVVSLPSWSRYTIENTSTEELVLLSYSDSPIFKAVGLYRESN